MASEELLNLYLSRSPLYFGGVDTGLMEASFLIVGVPFDSTASYRPGARFAPNAIRQAAANIEFYSPRRGLDIEHVKIKDLGDVVTVANVTQQIKIISHVSREIARSYDTKIPIYLGGEHTVTYGVIRGLAELGLKPCIVVLDAHLDMRDEYMGERFSHACVTRRIVEDGIADKVLLVGTRAYISEEIDFLKRVDNVIKYDSLDVKKRGLNQLLSTIEGFVEGCNVVHISVDMDVFDPAYAPGVGNPEPEGLTPTEVFDVVHYLAEKAADIKARAILDVVETNPLVDPSGITSVLAAKTIVEFIAAVTASRKD